MVAPEVGLVGLRAAQRPLLRHEACALHLHLQRTHDAGRNLALNLEHVVNVAVVGVRPALQPVAGADELGGDPHPIRGAPHAAFDEIGGAQSGADLAGVFRVPAVLERGGAPDGLETRDPHQEVEDLLRHAVAEVFLVVFSLRSAKGSTAIEWSAGTAAAVGAADAGP